MKKIISGLCATATALSLITSNPVQAIQFSDVSTSDWFYEPVTTAAERGFISGYQGVFLPNDNVTGAEFAVILAKAFYPSHVKYEYENNTGTWYDPYVNTLKHFALDDSLVFQLDFTANLTRSNAAILLCDVMAAHDYPMLSLEDGQALAKVKFGDLGLFGIETSVEDPLHNTLDAGKIGQVAGAGFMSGRSTEHGLLFYNYEPLTRAEASVIAVNMDNSQAFQKDLGVGSLFQIESRMGSLINGKFSNETLMVIFEECSFWDMGDCYLIHGVIYDMGPLFSTLYRDAGFFNIPKTATFTSNHEIGQGFSASRQEYSSLGEYVSDFRDTAYGTREYGNIIITFENGVIVDVARFYTQ